MVHIGNDWDGILHGAFSSDWYSALRERLKEEYSTYTVYPAMGDIYRALKATSFGDVKVVILGQDPYHNAGQANGLCFSVSAGTRLPPSLVNIFKELNDDLGYQIPQSGDLNCWASQGVLLLNTVLTVRADEPMSHRDLGWQRLTDEIFTLLAARKEPIVFILWGTHARQKKLLLAGTPHYIIESAHPSPLSAYSGFFGSKSFSRANEILAKLGKPPINWRVD